MSCDSTNSTSKAHRILRDEESQVCFVAALGCGLLGFLGVALESFLALSTPLSAFLMAGLIYLIAGFVRVIQLQNEAPRAVASLGNEGELEQQVVHSAA